MNIHQLNTLITVHTRGTFAFADETGAPIDPTTVTLYVLPPGGPLQTITTGITREGPGVYSYGVLGNLPGLWKYNWAGSGNVQVTSGDIPFRVEPSELIAA